MIPSWIEENSEALKTGSEVVDQIIVVMLTTSMFIAGALGFILDNTIPGSLEERGVIAWRSQASQHVDPDLANNLKVYDIPFITKYLIRWKWTRYIPCFPTFQRHALEE